MNIIALLENEQTQGNTLTQSLLCLCGCINPVRAWTHRAELLPPPLEPLSLSKVLEPSVCFHTELFSEVALLMSKCGVSSQCLAFDYFICNAKGFARIQ